jgi:DNA-binding FadR family transcriptional regulator
VLDPALTPADADAHTADYRRLVDAIVARDGAKAAAIAEQLTDFVLSRVRDRSTSRRRPIANVRANGKLAEGVARALQDDIERRGWPVGDVIGSETELVERYSVSRAILREAVRILEHHGAVRTKRGPHGGLIAAAPDSAALVRSARIVLEYEGVNAGHLVEAREVVEAAAARLAAARCTADDAARLAAALEAEERGGDAAQSFITLHDQVASTTRNGVLALFVDVVDSLVPTHVKPERRSGAGMASLSVEVHRAHERIVEAIVAGDADLAERRMVRHLRASGAVLK